MDQYLAYRTATRTQDDIYCLPANSNSCHCRCDAATNVFRWCGGPLSRSGGRPPPTQWNQSKL